jgi:hypothetical protein
MMAIRKVVSRDMLVNRIANCTLSNKVSLTDKIHSF